ncbi:MAG: UUP1 family membrane protein [Deltaproteobacteria bacterium]|nr:UUP1 family membrane protein [Deltaproteobacteria bacterium]
MRRPALILANALILLTCLLITYRVAWLGYPLRPLAAGQTWQLFIDVYLTPKEGNPFLALALPAEHTGAMIVDEQVHSGDYAFSMMSDGPNRAGRWTGTNIAGVSELTYRATIHTRPQRDLARQSPLLSPYPAALGPEDRRLAEETARPWISQAPATRFRAAMALLNGKTPKEMDSEAARRWHAIQNRYDRTDAALAVLRASDLPARAVEGLRLAEGIQTSPMRWIEAWVGRSWQNLNPETGEVYPPSTWLLPLAVAPTPAVRTSGAEVSAIRWNISRQVISQWKLLYERIVRSPHFLDRFSLLQLPPEFQGTFRILILVPIGALIISALRNVVGLPTFGIFMPLLIALAFRNTGTSYGVILFCGVLLVGYAARSYLDRLRLLLVPRLSVILTLVIGCFTVLALVGNRLGLREFMAVGLIPFVILTMTIERFFIIIEESGTREAFVTAAGSVAVAVATYGIISWEPLQLTFFVYPELILTVAALQILLGRYTGYRLSELLRFRSLGGAHDPPGFSTDA